MLKVGYLTEDAYNSAISQPLSIVQEEGEGSNENYMSSYAIHCAALALMKLDNFQFQYIFKDKSDYDSYIENYQATCTPRRPMTSVQAATIYRPLTRSFRRHCRLSLTMSCPRTQSFRITENMPFRVPASS